MKRALLFLCVVSTALGQVAPPPPPEALNNWPTAKTALSLTDPLATGKVAGWDNTLKQWVWVNAGSGGGTVTNAANLTNLAVLLGDGGTTGIKTSAGFTTDGGAKLVLGGFSGATGTIDFNNTTSGTITLQPVTGALGVRSISLPAASGTIALAATTLAGYGILDAQPLDSDLTTLAGLTATTDNFIVSVASAWASRTPTQVRTTLGLVIGTDVQAFDADLTTWAGITPGAGVGTFLATPSSANLAATVTGETGTGALVFATSPALTTPTGIVKGDVGLGNVDNTSDTTKNSATVTLTNKRINPRVDDQNPPTSPYTCNSDNFDIAILRGINAALTVNAPTGTPVNGQKLMLRFKDDTTARALTFQTGSSGQFRFSSDLAAPTTTVSNKALYMGFVWNVQDSRWDCVAILNNF